jgi:hypothetical protein
VWTTLITLIRDRLRKSLNAIFQPCLIIFRIIVVAADLPFDEEFMSLAKRERARLAPKLCNGAKVPTWLTNRIT